MRPMEKNDFEDWGSGLIIEEEQGRKNSEQKICWLCTEILAHIRVGSCGVDVSGEEPKYCLTPQPQSPFFCLMPDA